jgi:cytochrome d ubiquinol oxidase subunit I
MRHIYYVLIVLSIFFVILFGFIVPQQGGLTPSSDIYASQLTNTTNQETLPIQLVDLSTSGRSIFIAFVMLSHVVYANLNLGGAWVAAGTESVFLRTKKLRYERLARSITLFNVILFSAGATFAIAGVLFFISLFPTFASQVFHIYWWPLLAEAITFGLEIFFLYTYWFSWGKISNRWHQFLGYAYAVDVFVQTLLINTLASGMLTPGASTITYTGTGLAIMEWGTYLSWWFNASTWILQFHRLAAAVSFFGFFLALLGMLHYLDRKDQPSKTYWDLVGSYGISWGLIGLILQPLFGFIYMYTLFRNNIGAFSMIMLANRAWEMVLMVGLLATLFVVVFLYYYDRKEAILKTKENPRLHKLFAGFVITAVIAGFFLVQPYTTAWGINPLGLMVYKLVALLILVILGAIALGIDLIMIRNQQIVEWGNLSHHSRTALATAGILGIAIIVVMGYVRESARAPWTVYGIIPVPGGTAYPTPIPVYQMIIVWLLVIGFVVTIFWFTSRVTAEHPEEAEEV